jgi:hypothetical protein
MAANTCNPTTSKNRDATQKSYSSIDVASFDPLITDVVLIEQLAFALAIIELPQPFGRIFATWKSGALAGVEKDFCTALDRLEPYRLYKNALQQIFQSSEYREVEIDADLKATGNKIKYQLLDWTPLDQSPPIAKQLTDSKKELIRRALTDIGNRMCDLAIKQDVGAGVEVDPIELTSAEIEALKNWQDTVAAQLGKFNDVERRLHRISAVTPLGLMHRYRQHFFYAELQKGRCELIRSLAPYETLEIVTTEEKVTTTEETITKELEITTNTSREQKDSTELTDRVASTVANSSTSNISANGSYTAVLWSAGGSVSSSTSNSSTKTSEHIAKTLNDITQKQSEQIRKKTTVTTRIAETRSDSITTRHSFTNPNAKPVTYGLYKLGYEVKSAVQDMGPLLVWQTRIEKPGQSLAQSTLLDKQIRPAKIGLTDRVVRVTLHKATHVESRFTIDATGAMKEAFENEMKSAVALKEYPEYQEAVRNFYNPTAANPQRDPAHKWITLGVSEVPPI